MKKLLRQSILVACAFAMLTGGLCYASGTKPPSNANDSFVTTPTNGNKIDLGPTIELDAKGYPTKDSRQILLDEVAFQGAVAAYLQSIPRMSMYGSLKSAHYYGAAGNTDIFIQYKDPSVDGMLTPNRVVAYVWNYANLEKAGPLVYEFPAGATAGIIMDIQMRWYADLGTTSPLGGHQMVKYLLLTEGQEIPDGINRDKMEYEVVRIRTSHVSFIYRVLDPAKSPGLEKALKVYPYADRANPKPNKFFQAKKEDDTYFMTPPVGMAYWKQLHELIQVERVNEADRYMLARLKEVGIEKGKPFNPTERQKAILERAVLVGEKMAINVTFTTRSQAAVYTDDVTWKLPLTLKPSHRDGDIYQLREGFDWAYEAYGVSPAMMAGVPGKGSTYLGAYRDSEENWFEGGNEYVFHIEPNVPAARFWDLSVYRLDKRTLLPDVEGAISFINSAVTKGLKKNEDGFIDIYFGPGSAPKGYENNFIKTYEGMRWFCYFRLYGPTKAYFERSWPMNDIKKVKKGD